MLQALQMDVISLSMVAILACRSIALNECILYTFLPQDLIVCTVGYIHFDIFDV